MKKFITIILAAMIFAICGGAVLAEAETEIDSYTHNVVVKGIVPKENIGGGFVTICLINSETGEIKHIDQVEINADNTYFSKFKYDGDFSGCSLRVKAGSEDVTSSVLKATVHSSKMIASVMFDTDNANKYFDINDKISLKNKVINMYDDDAEYSLLLVSYAADGSLISAKKSDVVFVNFDENGKPQTAELKDCKIEEGTAYVKAFIWKDIDTNMIPLAESRMQKVGDKSYQSGDKIGFIGDSITHIGNYQYFIEHFYQTRYPNRKIDFYSKGINGQSIGDAYKRLDWDVLADGENRVTLMMGVNDVDINSADQSINSCVANAEKVVKDCIEKGVEIAIVTPPLYDDRDIVSAENGAKGKNVYMDKLCVGLRALAEKYGISVYDINALTNDVTNKNEDVQYVIQSGDRVHPTETGYIIIGYGYLMAQGVDAEVASVDIATDGNVKTSCCRVVNLDITDSRVEYMYYPESSPVASNVYYNNANVFVPTLTNDINRELVKIVGLSNGNYALMLDGQEAGVFTAEEFANGVNIATLENNPNQARAKKAYSKLSYDKRNEVRKLRDIVLTEIFAGSKYDLDDASQYAQLLEDYKNHWYIDEFKKYGTYAPQRAQIEKNVEKYTAEAMELSIPQAYKIVVKKISE